MQNNSLHVKGNLKSEDVAVSGLFSTHSCVSEGRGLAVVNGNITLIERKLRIPRSKASKGEAIISYAEPLSRLS